MNAAGLTLQPQITVPENASTVTIGTDGTVTAVIAGEAQPTNLGTINLVDFVNPAGLQSAGGNLYRETASSGTPTQQTPEQNGAGTIVQGALENSNVEVVEELVLKVIIQFFQQSHQVLVEQVVEQLL